MGAPLAGETRCYELRLDEHVIKLFRELLGQVGTEADGKTSVPFPYPHFIIENGIGSGIVENGNESG
jgi:hypothetical protein